MKRFSIQVIARIILIVANALVLSWIFGNMQLFFNQIILAVILILQSWELIHFTNHTNRELTRLFIAIKHSDFSATFNQPSMGKSFRDLQQSMNDIVQSYRDVKIEKEAQYQFLQLLVNQIQVGIISVMDDSIILINPVAEKILGVKGVRNWKMLEQMNPAVASQLKDDGKKLIEVRSKGGLKILAVEVSSLIMIDNSYQLITLQDINSEIEQKEIEAWHKLIRILTHEIMNSVTPIASLSETMQAMLSDKSGNQKPLGAIGEETVKDIRFSLNTIQKRSERLIDFVENYRRLTRIPKPVLTDVNVETLLLSIEDLMRNEIASGNIKLKIEVENPDLQLNIDPSLIEQLLINLIRNSIHALEERADKKIYIRAYTEDQAVVVEVNDNGKGIPERELKEIFVPFFSTKKEGSGIGLSLSKQIMSLHGGRIRVASVVNEGTSFYLMFGRV
jgi:nitrogen fixation/metabolism regulation signal transduction histidine kinase